MCSAITVKSNDQTVKEASDAFTATTRSLTTEIIAVTKALRWVKSRNYMQAGIMSDSNILKKIQAGSLRQQQLESL